MKSTLQPLIKYVGGKRKIASEILSHLPNECAQYVEPFVGGGGMFCEAFLQGLTKNGAHLNDLNPYVINLYRYIKNSSTAALQVFYADLQYLAEQFAEDPAKIFYAQRGAWNAGVRTNIGFIFLKQTAFNGLWRENRKGGFNVPIGSYKTFSHPDMGSLWAWHEALQNVKLTCGSFTEVKPVKGALVYCDPPYAGTFTSYTKDGFTEEVQRDLILKCAEWGISGVCAMSNSDDADFAQEVRELWPQLRKSVEINITHSVAAKASSRRRKTEMLYLS